MAPVLNPKGSTRREIICEFKILTTRVSMRASIAVDGAYDAAYPYIRASAAHTSSTSDVLPWENRTAIILGHETHDRLAFLVTGGHYMTTIPSAEREWFRGC